MSIEATPGIATTIITVSKQCPSVEPISGPVQHEGRAITAQQLTIVGDAIDAELFYVDDIKEFCRERWLAEFPAVDTCLTRHDGQDYEKAADDFHERRAQMAALDARLKPAPRGSWYLLRQDWQGTDGYGGTSWSLHIADGAGDVHAVQTGHIWSNQGRVPRYDDALRSLVGTEIYRATNAERHRRETARSRAIVAANGWGVGAKLRNLKVGSTEFSSAVITAVGPGGHLTLELTKRGARNRRVWTGLAQSVQVAGMLEAAPAYGQLISYAA